MLYEHILTSTGCKDVCYYLTPKWGPILGFFGVGNGVPDYGVSVGGRNEGGFGTYIWAIPAIRGIKGDIHRGQIGSILAYI